jgi:hypothetical protein
MPFGSISLFSAFFVFPTPASRNREIRDVTAIWHSPHLWITAKIAD